MIKNYFILFVLIVCSADTVQAVRKDTMVQKKSSGGICCCSQSDTVGRTRATNAVSDVRRPEVVQPQNRSVDLDDVSAISTVSSDDRFKEA